MSEINRMLRQLDQQEGAGELTLQEAPPSAPVQVAAVPAVAPPTSPALAPGEASALAKALHNASAAQAAAAASAADEAVAPPTAPGRAPVVKSAARWRLPAMLLVGAGAIGAVVLTDPSFAPALSKLTAVALPAQLTASPGTTPPALAAAAEPTAAANYTTPTALPGALHGMLAAAPVHDAERAPTSPAVAAQSTTPALAQTPAQTPPSQVAPAAAATAQPKPASPATTSTPSDNRSVAGNASPNPGPGLSPSPGVRTTAAGNGGATPALTDSTLARLGTLPPPLLATPGGRIDKRNLVPSNEQRARTLMQAATELARSGQRQAALQRAQEALDIEPGHVPARQLAAVLHHEAGQPALALGLLRDGVALEGSPPSLALLLARFLAHQNLGPEALMVLDRHSLNSAEAEGLRAGLLAQQGAYGSALVAYENALRQQPGQSTWWVGMAVALESEGQSARARQAYAHARQLGLAQTDLASYVDQRLRALD